MNVNGERIVKHNTIKYVNNETLLDWMSEPLKNGDLQLTSESPTGEILFIVNRTNFLLSQRLYGIRVNELKCSGLYLYFWLQTQDARKEMESRSTGTTVLGIKKGSSLMSKYLHLKKVQKINSSINGFS